MNNISIIGRLTKDIETQTTNNGTTFARFNVAVPNELQSKDGEKVADFFMCVAWRNTAETLAKYCKKGRQIGLYGSMNSRSYENQKGEKVTVWELNVKGFTFIGSTDEDSKEENTKSNKGKSKSTQPELTPLDDEDDDNLPF